MIAISWRNAHLSNLGFILAVGEAQKALDMVVGFSIDRFEEAKGFSADRVEDAKGFADVAAGFSTDRIEDVKGFSGDRVEDVKGLTTQVTSTLGPFLEDFVQRIMVIVQGVPLMIGIEKKSDEKTASTASLNTLDTQPKKTTKEDYNEFLKMMEK